MEEKYEYDEGNLLWKFHMTRSYLERTLNNHEHNMDTEHGVFLACARFLPFGMGLVTTNCLCYIMAG